MSEVLALDGGGQGLQPRHAGGGDGARGREPRARGRRGGGAGGAVGGGEVDAPAHRRAPRRAERRGGAAARAGHRAGSATPGARGSGATRWGSSISSTTCCPSSRRWRTWRCRSGRPAPARAAAEARARELLGRGRARAPAGPPAGGALGRRAAAGGAGARARQRAAAAAGGRADRQPRSRRPRARVFEVLMQLVRGTGLAALIATHNPELAARMDRVLRLDGGRIVECRLRAERRVALRPILQAEFMLCDSCKAGKDRAIVDRRVLSVQPGNAPPPEDQDAMKTFAARLRRQLQRVRRASRRHRPVGAAGHAALP